MRADTAGKISLIFQKITSKIITLFTAGMVITVSCNVVARYLLKTSMVWAEELSMLFFVWVVFLGAYYALVTKSHLALTFVVKRLPRRLRVIDKYVVLLLVLLFLIVLCVGGFEFVFGVIELGQRTALLKISAAWSYACIPASSVLMLFEVVRTLFHKEAIVELKEIGLDEKEVR